MELTSELDDYYTIFAWDIVDISFAIIVASLPTLNGLVDNAISTFTTWYSTHKSSTFSKLLASRSTSRGYRTKIGDQDSKTELQVDINKPKAVLHNASKSSADQYEASTWEQANDVELQTQARNQKFSTRGSEW